MTALIFLLLNLCASLFKSKSREVRSARANRSASLRQSITSLLRRSELFTAILDTCRLVRKSRRRAMEKIALLCVLIASILLASSWAGIASGWPSLSHRKTNVIIDVNQIRCRRYGLHRGTGDRALRYLAPTKAWILLRRMSPFMAQMRSPGMSAQWPLLGGKTDLLRKRLIRRS